MNGGNFDSNGSDLDKGHILKPTFDTLTEEGRKASKAYLTDLEELLLSHYEVARQGTILQDTTTTVFNKPEVTPKVQPDPSPSRNDIQLMINSALERQAKSTDELQHRLIEKRDRKNWMLLVLIFLHLLALLVSLKSFHTRVVHQWGAHQCQTLLSSR
jgi:hypothetical protein